MAREYSTYAAKRDPATGDIALRTIFPEDQGPQLAGLAWLVATSNSGARPATTAEVDSWDDMPDWTPPAPEGEG